MSLATALVNFERITSVEIGEQISRMATTWFLFETRSLL